ncbi:heavy-metal-associated domain-containing protein [Rhodospirillum sp. A1_3_36]|uniref:heavy-metal-associated domain-containing protein n=1 Tax=Rhodospirillum sp. A1_3_36 TaxID=3391666 RepID=UPI0039A4FEA6
MAKVYKVGGMTCGGCASSVEKAIKAVQADATVSVDLATGNVTVDGLDDDIAVEKAVDDAGFDFNGVAA